MFTESKVKKFFNRKQTHAYADSGTDIHITNPETVLQLKLQRHAYVKPVSIQFGVGSIQTATHFVFMGDILGEVAIIDTAPSTLISIYSITTKGLSVTFSNRRIKIVDEFTGRLIYRNRIITPGHYTINIEKFMQIPTPTDFKYYKQVSQTAANTYETMQEGYISPTYDTDASQDDPQPPPHPHTHTCIPKDEESHYHAFSSTADVLASETLSDITPTRKRSREPRLTASQTKKILWLHKCMGHPSRKVMATNAANHAWMGLPDGITAGKINHVMQRRPCTACDLAKRNKLDKQKGSGIGPTRVGEVLSCDYQGKIKDSVR
jgi:hypothetical protein